MKKGFTLIELLAVIIILGIIALVSVPIALNTIKDGKQDMYDEQIELIKSGARTLSSEAIYKSNKNTLFQEIYKVMKGELAETNVSLKILQENGYLNYEISNPLCNDSKSKYFDPETTMVQIKYNGKDFEFEVYNSNLGISRGKEGLENSCCLASGC